MPGGMRDLYEPARRLDVIWIEPIPDVFAQLERNIALLDGRLRAFREITANSEGDEIELKIASQQWRIGRRSSTPSTRAFGRKSDTLNPLSLKTSDACASFFVMRGSTLPAYDALAIDTQGSELLVLKGAGEALRNFRYIKTEAADFEAYRG